MRCPYCACEDTQVKDSRPTEENAAIRRRRVCPDCGGRFTTFERVQLRELVVVKRSGRKVTFDRDKLLKSVEVALRSAIESLDGKQREVLVLRDIEGLSAPEVAKVLGSSVQAVKSRLHRARVAVRERVAPLLGLPVATAPRQAGCRDVLRLFSRHLEGEIAPEVCADMEAHLRRCDRCRGACESLKRTLALCRATPAPEVPLSVRESVRDAIRVFLEQRPA